MAEGEVGPVVERLESGLGGQPGQRLAADPVGVPGQPERAPVLELARPDPERLTQQGAGGALPAAAVLAAVDDPVRGVHHDGVEAALAEQGR